MDILNNESFLQSDFNILFKNNIKYFNEFIILSKKINKTKLTSHPFNNYKINNNTLYARIQTNYFKYSKLTQFKCLSKKVNNIFIIIIVDHTTALINITKLIYNLPNHNYELSIDSTSNALLKFDYLSNSTRFLCLKKSIRRNEKSQKIKNIAFPNSIECLSYEFHENFILPYKTKFLSCSQISLLKNRTNNLKFLNTVGCNINYKHKHREKYSFNNLQVVSYKNSNNQNYYDNYNESNNISYDTETLITYKLCNSCISQKTKNIIYLGDKIKSNIKLPNKMNSICLINSNYMQQSFNINLLQSVKVNFLELIKYEFQKSHLDEFQKYVKIISARGNIYFISCSQTKYSNILYDSIDFNRKTITSNIIMFKKNISEYIDK